MFILLNNAELIPGVIPVTTSLVFGVIILPFEHCQYYQIMWRYIKGVDFPQKRSLKTPEEKADYHRDYDKTKRVRSYHSEWEQDRPWLSNSPEKGMVCSVCQKYGDPTSNTFVSGCNSYKLDSVTKHEKSKSQQP